MAQRSDPQLTDLLARRLAERLAADPDFLAAVFAGYKAHAGADDDQIAHRLGADPSLLPRLALCRRPRPDLFRDDVESIAGEFGLDAAKFADFVRHADVLTAFAAPAATGQSQHVLAAARDRAAEDGTPYDTGPDAGPAPDDPEGGQPS